MSSIPRHGSKGADPDDEDHTLRDSFHAHGLDKLDDWNDARSPDTASTNPNPNSNPKPPPKRAQRRASFVGTSLPANYASNSIRIVSKVVDPDVHFAAEALHAQLEAALVPREVALTLLILRMRGMALACRHLIEFSSSQPGQRSASEKRDIAESQSRLATLADAIESIIYNPTLLMETSPAFERNPRRTAVEPTRLPSRLQRLHALLKRSEHLQEILRKQMYDIEQSGVLTGNEKGGGGADEYDRSEYSREEKMQEAAMKSKANEEIQRYHELAHILEVTEHRHKHFAKLLEPFNPITEAFESRVRKEGINFVTSTFFFNTPCPIDGQSIGSLLIRSNNVPMLEAVYTKLPQLTVPAHGMMKASSSSGDRLDGGGANDLSNQVVYDPNTGTVQVNEHGVKMVYADAIKITPQTVNFSSAASLCRIGMSLHQLRASGRFPRDEILRAGFSGKELRHFGFTCEDMRKAGYSVSACRRAGFDAMQLRAGGFDEAMVVGVLDFHPRYCVV